jgi:hypothetical protein
LYGGPRLLQAGLFDHRAAREAAALDATREALRRSGAERLLALDAASGVSLAGEPDLALMLVVSG